MAKKTVRVSDLSGREIPEGKGAMIKIIFQGARKGVRELDAPDEEAEKLGGRQTKRRARRTIATRTQVSRATATLWRGSADLQGGSSFRYQ